MKTGKQILAWVLCLMMLCGVLPMATNAETLPADVSEPASGNLLVDVTGQYYSCGKDSALRRLNTYRYQACYYGDKDPRNSDRNLELADRSGGENPSDAVLAKANGDYVPAMWSYELERIAEIRAAEGSVYMSHTRPNGKSCFSVKINNVSSSAECLAWGSSMLGGMQQWYGERSAWLGTSSGETGHYRAMINPSYTSYGIAAFSDNGASFVTVALEARTSAASNQDAIGRTGQHTQRMEMSQSALTGVSVDGRATMTMGETQVLTANADVRYSGLYLRTGTFPVAKGAVWTSSDTSVATVDASGKVCAAGAGTATITAAVGQHTGSITIQVGGAQYHTVTFDGNCGKPGLQEKTTAEGETIGSFPDVERDGYTLDGWFTQPTGGTKLDETWVPAGSTRVYAHWSRAAEVYYTVTLDAAGGTCSVQQMRFAAYDTYHDLPTPVREGYRFDGWFKDGGYECTSQFAVNSDHTIHAHWTEDPRTYFIIILDGNDGYCAEESVSVPEGEGIGSIPSAYRVGYVFEGWYTRKNGGVLVTSAWQPEENATLYAHWKKTSASYTVTFDANGGTCDETRRTYAYSEDLGALPVPIRAGYVFEGWSTLKYPKAQVAETFRVTGSMTLYAFWHELQTFTVTFDVNGGSGSYEARTIQEGQPIGALPTPTRNGYAFDGWYTAASGGKAVKAAWKPNANTSIYAHWTKTSAEYQVIFDPNGGTVSPETKQVTEGEPVGALPTPTFSGKKFLGWYNGSISVTEDTVLTGNVTLVAKWGELTFHITFNANGGNCSQQEADLPESVYASELPKPTREGYRFEGWCFSDGARVPQRVYFCSDTTLTAKWHKLETYTIAFDSQGGVAASQEVLVQEGDPISALPTATRAGYRFDGWFTEKAGGTQVFDSWYPGADATVYAHWTRVYTVTFDATGGTAIHSSQQVVAGDSLGTIPSAAKDGYQYLGWFTDREGGVQISSAWIPTQDATVYAHWEKNKEKYTITLDAEGGVSELSSVSVWEGLSLGYVPFPTREGYTFLGWYTASAGGDQVFSSWVPTGSTTIFARWEKVKAMYTLILDTNGGDEPNDTWPVFEGDRVAPAWIPVREGYTFTGWFTDPTGGERRTRWTITGDETVYAHWTPKSTPTPTATPAPTPAATPVPTPTATPTSTPTAAPTGTPAAAPTATPAAALTSVTVLQPPVITLGPKSITVNKGETARFTVEATGATSYQWYCRKATGTSWAKVKKATKATLTFASKLTESGNQYRCVVKNRDGSVTSAEATLMVTNHVPEITGQPRDMTVDSGQSVRFEVEARYGQSYQWYCRKSAKASWTKIKGATKAVLTFTAKVSQDGYQYRCVVKNTAGKVTSQAAALQVKAHKPIIAVQTGDRTAAVGQEATFMVTAQYGESYQWYYRKTAKSSWTKIKDATEAALTVTAKKGMNGYQYRCVVKNADGSATSDPAILTVR